MKRKKGPEEEPEKGQGPKKKEQKIVYIDDGSTVADMSGTYRGGRGKEPAPRTTFKEKMKTFFTVMRKMLLPCLVTLIAFTLVFLLFQCLAGNL